MFQKIRGSYSLFLKLKGNTHLFCYSTGSKGGKDTEITNCRHLRWLKMDSIMKLTAVKEKLKKLQLFFTLQTIFEYNMRNENKCLTLRTFIFLILCYGKESYIFIFVANFARPRKLWSCNISKNNLKTSYIACK